MAILTIQNLSYVTPDGRSLFEKLDLSFGRERTGLIGRNGAGKTTLLRILAGELRPAAGSVHRDGIVRLQHQQVFAEKSATVSDVFGVSPAIANLRRALDGQVTPEEYVDIDWSLEARLEEALGMVGLAGVGADRLAASLSGGQRTRLALAALTFHDPDMILLDEPTNNLDRDGRAMVYALMQQFRGGVLIASHDRDLLRRVDRIAELSARGVRVYGGGWDDYRALRSVEREAAAHRLADAEQRLKTAKRKAQAEREKKARRDSAGRRSRSGGGDTKLAMDARADRAGNTGKRLSRLAQARVARAADELANARAKVDRASDVSFGLPSTCLPARKRVLAFDQVTCGYRDNAPLFRDLSFEIVGPQRVCVAGPNGVGKTTLLRAATGNLAPVAGTIVLSVRTTMLDQDAAILDRRSTILENFKRLNPGDSETACRSALASFLFRTDAALRSVADLSGGEMIRAGLVCALGGQNTPELLILDEPTNHLDLESIEAIETGLNGYDGAILIVSHDADFLSAIGADERILL